VYAVPEDARPAMVDTVVGTLGAGDESTLVEAAGTSVEIGVDAGGVEASVDVASGVDTMRRGMLETDAAVSTGIVDAGAGNEASTTSLVEMIELKTGAGALVNAATSTLLAEVASATSSPAVTQTVCTTSTVAVTTSQAVTTTRSRLSSGAAVEIEARRKPRARCFVWCIFLISVGIWLILFLMLVLVLCRRRYSK